MAGYSDTLAFLGASGRSGGRIDGVAGREASVVVKVDGADSGECTMSSESTFPIPEPIEQAGSGSGWRGGEQELLALGAAATVDRTVHEHRWCLSCGYDLFGLDRDGVCPECGRGVAKSLEGDLLRNCGRAFVKRLRVGMLMAGCGTVLLLVNYLAVAAIGSSGWGNRSPTELLLIRALVSSVGGLMVAIGWWIFSSKDTARFGPDPATRTRTLLRVMVILDAFLAVCAAGSMMAVMAWGGLTPRGGGGALQVLSNMQWVIWWLFQLFGWFPKMFYVALLARRVPNRSLESFARVVMWLGLLKLAVCVGEIPCFILAIFVYVTMVRALDAVLAEMPETVAGDEVRAAG